MAYYRVLQKPITLGHQTPPSFAEVVELSEAQAVQLIKLGIVKGPLKDGQWEEEELVDHHRAPRLPRIEDLLSPSTEAPASTPAASSGSTQSEGAVNLNTADFEALKALPNIGKATANKILAARGEGYESIEDAFIASQLTQAEWDEAIAQGVTL